MVRDQHVIYDTKDTVCAAEIHFDVVNGRCHNVAFKGGCKGNTQGVAALAEGMLLEDIALRLTGIDCHGGHSCPDELSKAVREVLEQEQ